ncbi:MAG: UDP-N-acetylmuramoyl-tripeptide--D-alanyl-D-alanine ligase [Bacteroidaceae bacterium]|nr:UDP-N-acetylmuramoyl-tripeptide--D-alanyl-D-alanine ligase [Bacteroidaceae bacterium]
MTIEQLYEIFLRHPQVTTDSRRCPEGSIFFALKGDTFNGNRFAATALQNGCAYAVIDEPVNEPHKHNDSRYILVGDVLTTLQQLAHIHREHFRGPVIQITGTNGKTTTKELVSTVLSQKYNVLYTQGNLNNHIGVPLTLLRLTPDHDIAVIETGANHPGEIKTLAEIVDPDFGLITNVGVAHIEGFGSFEGVVKTKGELYDYLRSKDEAPGNYNIFLNADNPHLTKIAEGLTPFTYGQRTPHYNVEGEVLECAPFLKLRWSSMFNVQSSMSYEVQTHLIGAYNIDNVLAAVSVGIHFGVEPEQINKALVEYVPTNNRSEMRRTQRNVLIVDAYNANPSSMKAALENFALITPPEGTTKMLILGEMRELGEVSEREHASVIEQIKTMFNGKPVWLVGKNFQRLNPPFRTFADAEEVKAQLKDHPIEGHLILIKGSNGTRLFELPEYL